MSDKSISVKNISIEEYPLADKLLEQYLFDGRRPRSYEFLFEKLKKNPGLFLGLYLDDLLIGVVQGFPKDNYLLLSEIAVDAHFRDRGFGTSLLKAFEVNARKLGFKRIKLGAHDESVNLYLNNGYSPSLFLQVNDPDFVLPELVGFTVIDVSEHSGISGIELAVDEVDMALLESLKKRFNPLSIQYLFFKDL